MIASRRRRHVLCLAFVFTVPRTAEAAAPGVSVVAIGPDPRLTIPVMINGSGPYPFVLDTGSDRTVISSELAAILKLPAGRGAFCHKIAKVVVT